MACDKQLLLRNAWLRAQTIGRVHYAELTQHKRTRSMRGDAAFRVDLNKMPLRAAV